MIFAKLKEHLKILNNKKKKVFQCKQMQTQTVFGLKSIDYLAMALINIDIYCYRISNGSFTTINQ